MARRPVRLQRRRIFLGCEGESERSYAVLLAQLVEQRHQKVHVDAVPLAGGDPLAIVKQALIQHRRRASRGDYAYRAILLDADTLGRAPRRDEEARATAFRHGFKLIWQEPSHEALLLLHLVRAGGAQPQTALDARHALERLWPGYQKALPAVRLGGRIDRAAVLRARAVHEGLREFLDRIEFGEDP